MYISAVRSSRFRRPIVTFAGICLLVLTAIQGDGCPCCFIETLARMFPCQGTQHMAMMVMCGNMGAQDMDGMGAMPHAPSRSPTSASTHAVSHSGVPTSKHTPQHNHCVGMCTGSSLLLLSSVVTGLADTSVRIAHPTFVAVAYTYQPTLRRHLQPPATAPPHVVSVAAIYS
jgi:hypothetical protein